MTKKTSSSILAVFLIFFSLFSTSALAQGQGLRQKPDGLCPEKTIYTAIGCVSTQAEGKDGFISQIMTVSIGLGGSIALILLLFGFYLLGTSAGIPDKITAAKELITSAIGGLIFMVMAVVLLNFIGINVLRLPGLQ